MTASRSVRSAWLLVGCTPGCAAKVHSAGQTFSKVACEAPALAVAGLGAGVLAQDRLEFVLQRSDAPLELCALTGVLEDLPRPEDLVADPEAVLAELLVGAAALGMKGEVALQVRPADLSSPDGQVAVGPPAV